MGADETAEAGEADATFPPEKVVSKFKRFINAIL